MTSNSTCINHNHLSYKKIQLTAHCRQRSFERLHITSNDELKKLACKARNQGVNIQNVNIRNYETLGLDYATLVAIKTKFYKISNTEKMYYYNNFIYTFRGKSAMTLISIIPVHIDSALKHPVFN